jgi:hypothetical protein
MSKHVTTGEKFRFGARTYNELNRLIDQDRQSSLLMQGRSARGAVDWVRVKNTSGTDVGRFGVLGIAGILFDPATALPAFVSRTVFTGQTPTEAHQTGRFLICAEPIKNGAIGRAWADGIVTVRVEVLDVSHQYATVKPDDTTQLVSVDQGLCSILYKEAGTGTKWAVVRYGSTGNSLRWAFCSEAAGVGNTLDCYLDTDGTGTLVTVYFKLLNCSSLDGGHLTLTDGIPIPVMKRAGNWWCIIPIEGTEVVV